eukprot:TRINITY_DN1116_c0_g1_i11.p1 TRINITY_DN1116_c0_g1~~TRINITY_DN1116_c0_g1_i11.p1  ORF type:complete len:219 (-),score=45.42 TRINITY_DN1116_c0_g1_i11:237-893(-)
MRFTSVLAVTVLFGVSMKTTRSSLGMDVTGTRCLGLFVVFQLAIHSTFGGAIDKASFGTGPTTRGTKRMEILFMFLLVRMEWYFFKKTLIFSLSPPFFLPPSPPLLPFSPLPLPLPSLFPSSNQVWCINRDGEIFRRRGPSAPWEKVEGHLTCVSCHDANTVIGNNKDGEVFIWDGQRWVKQEGKTNYISTGGRKHSRVWSVNPNNEVWRYEGEPLVH